MTSSSLYYVCVIFMFCVVPISLSYAKIGSESHKIIMPCETPNNKFGYCVELQNCKGLLKLLKNKRAWAFLRESQCAPRNNPASVLVCCETRDIFWNDNTKAANDDDIFPESCGQQRVIIENRIVGGKEASAGEYPWMARIVHKDDNGILSHGCAGFLIHPYFVMTAAHCIHPYNTMGKGRVNFVRLAEHDTEKETNCFPGSRACVKSDKIRVARVISHPDFNPRSRGFYNDIAILELKRRARTSEYIQPICLPKDDSYTPPRYYINGWGKTEKELTSRRKIKVEIPAFDKDKCSETYSTINVYLKDNQICAGGVENEDSCGGDSGGPLMMYSDNGTWYASGVVSFGIGCGMKGWPGVYTDIVKFLPWIKSEIRKLNGN